MVYELYLNKAVEKKTTTAMENKREADLLRSGVQEKTPKETGLRGDQLWNAAPGSWVILDGKELCTIKGLEGNGCKMFWGDALLLLSLWKVSHKVNLSEDSQGCFVERDSGSSPGLHSYRESGVNLDIIKPSLNPCPSPATILSSLILFIVKVLKNIAHTHCLSILTSYLLLVAYRIKLTCE